MLTITPDTLDTFFTNNAPYLVHLDGQQICADPRDKGEPGDTVVLADPKIVKATIGAAPSKHLIKMRKTGRKPRSR